jgi:hypothetical protein
LERDFAMGCHGVPETASKERLRKPRGSITCWPRIADAPETSPGEEAQACGPRAGAVWLFHSGRPLNEGRWHDHGPFHPKTPGTGTAKRSTSRACLHLVALHDRLTPSAIDLLPIALLSKVKRGLCG